MAIAVFLFCVVVALIEWQATRSAWRRPRVGPPPRRRREHPLDSLALLLVRGEVAVTGLQERTVSGRLGGRAVAVVSKRPYQGRTPLEYRVAVSRRVRMHLANNDCDDVDGLAYFQLFVRGEVVATSARILGDPRVQRQLRFLFRSGIDELRFEDGWITALNRGAWAYDRGDNTTTLRALDRLACLARAVDEAINKVGVKTTVRYRRREGEKCPYCHDALGSELGLVTCQRCRTIHHGACFSELGHCTAMGCQSRRSLPALQREEGIVEPFVMELSTCELCGAPTAGATDSVCTSERCGASLAERRRHERHQALRRRRTRQKQRGAIRLRPPQSGQLEPPEHRRRRGLE